LSVGQLDTARAEADLAGRATWPAGSGLVRPPDVCGVATTAVESRCEGVGHRVHLDDGKAGANDSEGLGTVDGIARGVRASDRVARTIVNARVPTRATI
jgi:hypothetical protein